MAKQKEKDLELWYWICLYIYEQLFLYHCILIFLKKKKEISSLLFLLLNFYTWWENKNRSAEMLHYQYLEWQEQFQLPQRFPLY